MAYHADTTSGAYGRGQAYQKYKRDAENTKAITNIANEAANLAKIGLQAYSAQQQENADIVSKGSEYENTVRQNQENGFIGSNPDIDGIEDAYNTSQGKINDDFLKQGLKETYGWSDKKIAKYLASEEHQKLVDTYSGNRYQVAEGTTASVKAKTEIQGRMAIIDSDPNMSFEDKMTAKNAILDEYGDGYSYDANGTLVTTRIDENYNYNLKPGDEGYIYRWDTDGSLSGETGRQQGVFSAFAGSAKTLIDSKISKGALLTTEALEQIFGDYWDSQASAYYGDDSVGIAASAAYKDLAVSYAKEYYNTQVQKRMSDLSTIYSNAISDISLNPDTEMSLTTVVNQMRTYGFNPEENGIDRLYYSNLLGSDYGLASTSTIRVTGSDGSVSYVMGSEIEREAYSIYNSGIKDVGEIAEGVSQNLLSSSFSDLEDKDKETVALSVVGLLNRLDEESLNEIVSDGISGGLQQYDNLVDPLREAKVFKGEGYVGQITKKTGNEEIDSIIDNYNEKIAAGNAVRRPDLYSVNMDAYEQLLRDQGVPEELWYDAIGSFIRAEEERAFSLGVISTPATRLNEFIASNPLTVGQSEALNYLLYEVIYGNASSDDVKDMIAVMNSYGWNKDGTLDIKAEIFSQVESIVDNLLTTAGYDKKSAEYLVMKNAILTSDDFYRLYKPTKEGKIDTSAIENATLSVINQIANKDSGESYTDALLDMFNATNDVDAYSAYSHIGKKAPDTLAEAYGMYVSGEAPSYLTNGSVTQAFYEIGLSASTGVPYDSSGLKGRIAKTINPNYENLKGKEKEAVEKLATRAIDVASTEVAQVQLGLLAAGLTFDSVRVVEGADGSPVFEAKDGTWKSVFIEGFGLAIAKDDGFIYGVDAADITNANGKQISAVIFKANNTNLGDLLKRYGSSTPIPLSEFSKRRMATDMVSTRYFGSLTALETGESNVLPYEKKVLQPQTDTEKLNAVKASFNYSSFEEYYEDQYNNTRNNITRESVVNSLSRSAYGR